MSEEEMKNIIFDSALAMTDKVDVVDLLISAIEVMTHEQLLTVVKSIGQK